MTQQEERIVVGLDIGTTKVCAIVASLTADGEINILGIGTASSDGLNRGVVANIDKTVASIEKAVAEAEAQCGIKIREVNVGIAGDHIRSFQSRGVITISNATGEVSQADVDRLLEDTKKVAIPADRKILHVIPQEFIIDGQDGIYEPIGMSGVRMEATVHIITGNVSAAKNIYKCVERAGLKVRDMVLEPLASSYAVLTDEEKEVGVALIDIGGGTTDIAVFEERTIRHTAVVAVAGQKVTDDIRKGLGVLKDQAEKMKREFGCTHVSSIMSDDEIHVPGIAGRKQMTIRKSLLARVIQPRMEEIFEFALAEIKRSGYSKHLSAGIVVTGGGALVQGTQELAQEVFEMPVKIGIPMGFTAGLAPEIENPMYATSVGLILHGMRSLDISAINDQQLSAAVLDEPTSGSRRKKSIFQRMKEWFDEL